MISELCSLLTDKCLSQEHSSRATDTFLPAVFVRIFLSNGSKAFPGFNSISTTQFCSGTTNGWELQKGQEQVISISRAAVAGGASVWKANSRMEVLGSAWFGKLALRDQGSQPFKLQMIEGLFLSLPPNHVPSGIPLSPLPHDTADSLQLLLPLHYVLQPRATGSCFELARQSSTLHILHTWQSSSVL